MKKKKNLNKKKKPIKEKKKLIISSPKPAYIDSSDENLDNGFYCKICGMSYYNCLCSHEDL